MTAGWKHAICFWAAISGVFWLGACCPVPSNDRPAEMPPAAPMDSFGYRQWISPDERQSVVIIGIHGFCGASSDYAKLGRSLMEYQPKTGLYAYELRGQGSDPIIERRGDIGHPVEWYRDLHAFTQLVRQRHPQAKIVWYGESMGALIATHALVEGERPSCDGLILSSPIVRFRDDIPDWTPGLVRLAATAMPTARISLETLMAGQEVQMTSDSFHGEQARKNPYHIEDYTLRLIGTLSQLIAGMNDCAARLPVPVLVLHGGRDPFNSDRDIRGFVARLPEPTPATYQHYPKAYHLLMHDEQRNHVFRDVRKWIRRLDRGKF